MTEHNRTGRTENGSSWFIVGGRYSNRLGEYEVLTILGDEMLIRYDDGREARVTRSTQARIAQNMATEAADLSPYPKTQRGSNEAFFWSIGFLAARVRMLEAIIPPKSLAGFLKDYIGITNQRPRHGQSGYYVHRPRVDKWGCELRITFEASDAEVARLDFGPTVNVVDSPGRRGSQWRINNNGFWWRLLRFGFSMGDMQNDGAIRANIPAVFREQVDDGLRAGKNS